MSEEGRVIRHIVVDAWGLERAARGGSGRGSRSSPQKERMARTPARRGLLLTYIYSYCCVVGDGRSGESHRPSSPHVNSTSNLCKEEEGDDDDEERRKGGRRREEGRKRVSE